MDRLPTGTVTFLFTDVEGSTRLLQALGTGFEAVLARQADLIRKAVDAAGGVVFGSEGDAVFAAFADPEAAVGAARQAQLAITAEPWPDGNPIRVRMGLHTGTGTLGGDNYVGIDVHRVARIAAAGHGGQVVVSGATRTALADATASGAAWLDLGEHRLKDLDRPEHLYQLVGHGLRRDFPPIRTVSSRPSNLPVDATSFVARSDELLAIQALVRRTRLVTLTGPGGSGKTRLAIEAARLLLADFADGVTFVDLSSVTDPRLVGPTIASSLGVGEVAGQLLEVTVAANLAGSERLIVLDNFEQVLDGAPFLGRLLAAVPRAKALVTSRAPLRLAGEREFTVEPLALPDPGHAPTAADLAGSPAVELFLDRARAVRPDFELTDAAAPAIAAIVKRLDGLPLALELGATWLRVLSPSAIAERLAGGRSLVEGGARDRPARHQTLRATIEWSNDLLPPSQQALLSRVAIFAGGADLDAIEAICAPEQDLGLDVLDGIAGLTEASLIQPVNTDHGAARFRLLETIRAFALERLGLLPELAGALGTRHATYFLGVATSCERGLSGADLGLALSRLDVDADNLRVALRWYVDHDDAERGIRLASAIWRYWQIRGRLTEGRRIVTELLALPSADGPTPCRAEGLTTLGSLAYWQVDTAATVDAYAEALAIERQIGDRAQIAGALSNVAFGEMLAGRSAEAAAYFAESLPIDRELGRSMQVAAALTAIGFITAPTAPDEARSVMSEALELYEALGDRYWQSQVHIGLAVADRLGGNLPSARAELAAALASVALFGDVSALSQVLDQLAVIDALLGRFDRSVRLAAASSRLRDEDGAGSAPPAFAQMLDVRALAEPTLGNAGVDREWALGRSLSREAVVTLATESAATDGS